METDPPLAADKYVEILKSCVIINSTDTDRALALAKRRDDDE
jgi:hypothetical protein